MYRHGFVAGAIALMAVVMTGAMPVAAAGGGDAYLVKDINPAPSDGPSAADPDGLTDAAGTLFFRESGPGGIELYRSDGSETGTFRLSIRPGAKGSNPQDITAIGSKVFFSANDGEHGRELWMSDGTPTGTVMVKDIKVGSKGSEPRSLETANGLLYFSAADGAHGRELWVSDGTSDGTHMLRDLKVGTKGSDPQELVAVGNRVFFRAAAPSTALWATDGTSAGTTSIPGGDIKDARQMTQVNDKLFFIAYESTNPFDSRITLRVVSPGANTSTFLSELPECEFGVGNNCHVLCGDTECNGTNDLTAAGGLLYYVTDNDQLWRSNGTRSGTFKLKTLFGCDPHSFVCAKSFLNVSGKLFFMAPRFEFSDATQEYEFVSLELWRSNGTKAGTKAVRVFDPYYLWYYVADCPNCYVGNFVVGAAGTLNGEYFFNGPNNELWASDGTDGGTTRACGPSTPEGQCAAVFPARFVKSSGSLYLTANDQTHGREVWRYVP